jgi:restriction system protein
MRPSVQAHPTVSRSTKKMLMAVPDFQSMMRPVLALHADGQPHTSADVRDAVADVLGVTEDDRQVPLPSGRSSRYANRVAWAVTHMAQALVLERPTRGVTRITDRGRDVLAKHPDRVDMGVLAQFPEYLEFRSGSHRHARKEPGGRPTPEEPTQHLSPTEAITEVIDEAHSTVAGDLLARILLRPPVFLERLVLKLLVSMGYGGLEAMTHLGGPGDQGLDGLIRQDLLGLDVVYVQAKRYATDHKVGRPDIQGFVGALHGAQASRGIFITTSSFSAEARDYADRVPARVVLIDGPELAQLMVEHNCGVRVEDTFTLKEVDEDFFDET